MHVPVRSGLRLIGVFAALALLLSFLQPNAALAATTFTISKTVSAGFDCSTLNSTTDLSTLTYGSTASAHPGQCVAVNLSITNNSTDTAITGITLADTFPSTLSGCSFAQGSASATCPAGSTSSDGCFFVASSGYSCAVTTGAFSFSTNGATYTLGGTGAAATGTEYFVVQVNSGTLCGSAIQNTGTGTVTSPSGFTPTNPSTAGSSTGASTATINVACPALTGVTFQKLVAAPNSATYGTTATASPGTIVTYDFRFTNTTGTSYSSVAINDGLAAGQTPVSSTGGSCIFSSGALNCTTSVAANATTDVLVRVQLSNPFTGTSPISNTAFATFPGGGTLQSNSTAVTVTSVPTTVSQLSVCGLISAYTAPNSTTNTAGSITIGGLVIPIAVGATSNVAIATGVNECITFAFTNAQASTLTVSSNLSGLEFACGTFTASSTAGQILVGGFPITVAAGANFVGFLTPGAFYCFLLSNGQAFAALTGIPTAAHSLGGGGRVHEYMA